LRWYFINTTAPFLSSKFDNENFDFYGRYLSGTKEQQPRWRRCVTATDNNLGEALGQAYVKKNFPPESRARMNKLIDDLFAAVEKTFYIPPQNRSPGHMARLQRNQN
jgi:putative endopeptidase